MNRHITIRTPHPSRHDVRIFRSDHCMWSYPQSFCIRISCYYSWIRSLINICHCKWDLLIPTIYLHRQNCYSTLQLRYNKIMNDWIWTIQCKIVLRICCTCTMYVRWQFASTFMTNYWFASNDRHAKIFFLFIFFLPPCTNERYIIISESLH